MSSEEPEDGELAANRDEPTDEAPAAKGRVLTSLSTILAVLVIVGGLSAIATPKFSAARMRANYRGCYANQKTIAGAIEMYNLDFNTSITSLKGKASSLVENGYLQSLPRDPGEGKDPLVNYVLKIQEKPCLAHAKGADQACKACRKNREFWVECEKHGRLYPR